MWIASLIGIILLYFAYIYLQGLKTCKCVDSGYTTRLKDLELILLVINSVFFLLVVLNAFHLLGALETIKKHIFKLIALVGIAILVFYSYFIYTSYGFWNTMQDNCKCADGWEKYYIYIQTIAFALIILFTVGFGLASFSIFKRTSIGPSNLSVIATKRRSKRTIK
jgi:hypothetical protein